MYVCRPYARRNHRHHYCGTQLALATSIWLALCSAHRAPWGVLTGVSSVYTGIGLWRVYVGQSGRHWFQRTHARKTWVPEFLFTVICTSTHQHIHIHTRRHAHMHTHIYIHTRMHSHTHMHTHACKRVRMEGLLACVRFANTHMCAKIKKHQMHIHWNIKLAVIKMPNSSLKSCVTWLCMWEEVCVHGCVWVCAWVCVCVCPAASSAHDAACEYHCQKKYHCQENMRVTPLLM